MIGNSFAKDTQSPQTTHARKNHNLQEFNSAVSALLICKSFRWRGDFPHPSDFFVTVRRSLWPIYAKSSLRSLAKQGVNVKTKVLVSEIQPQVHATLVCRLSLVRQRMLRCLAVLRRVMLMCHVLRRVLRRMAMMSVLRLVLYVLRWPKDTSCRRTSMCDILSTDCPRNIHATVNASRLHTGRHAAPPRARCIHRGRRQ